MPSFFRLNRGLAAQALPVKRAGQSAPGEGMGGWYDNADEFDPHGTFHGFIPGHRLWPNIFPRPGPRRRGDWIEAERKLKCSASSRASRPPSRQSFTRATNSARLHLAEQNQLRPRGDAHEFAGDRIALDVLNAATDAVLPTSATQSHGARRAVRAAPTPTEAVLTGTRPTLLPCSFSPGVAVQAAGIATWPSASLKTISTSIRSLKIKTFFPASMPTVTSTRSPAPCRPTWYWAAKSICAPHTTASTLYAPRRALLPADGDRM